MQKIGPLLFENPPKLVTVTRGRAELFAVKGYQRIDEGTQPFIVLITQLQFIEGDPAVRLTLFGSADQQLLCVFIEVEVVEGKHLSPDELGVEVAKEVAAEQCTLRHTCQMGEERRGLDEDLSVDELI